MAQSGTSVRGRIYPGDIKREAAEKVWARAIVERKNLRGPINFFEKWSRENDGWASRFVADALEDGLDFKKLGPWRYSQKDKASVYNWLRLIASRMIDWDEVAPRIQTAIAIEDKATRLEQLRLLYVELKGSLQKQKVRDGPRYTNQWGVDEWALYDDFMRKKGGRDIDWNNDWRVELHHLQYPVQIIHEEEAAAEEEEEKEAESHLDILEEYKRHPEMKESVEMKNQIQIGVGFLDVLLRHHDFPGILGTLEGLVTKMKEARIGSDLSHHFLKTRTNI